MRKLQVPAEVARRKVELLCTVEVVRVDEALVFDAIDLHRLQQLSFWDALVICAARAGGCRRVLTEDMSDGATIAGVRVINPFGMAR